MEPTVFTDVSPDMRIAKEEIFGPVLTVFKARDLKDAIEISNSVEFGLSSSVYTRDISRAFEYINTVETGMVHVNAPTLGGEVHLPFGGLKSSGVGQREQGTEAFRLLHRDHHGLHRPRRGGQAAGAVYLMGAGTKSSGRSRRTLSRRVIRRIVATSQRVS